MIMKPIRINDLDTKQLRTIMNRSMEDIVSVYDHVRKIVRDVNEGGDRVLLEMSREFKNEVVKADLEVTQEEIRRSYDEINPSIVEALKIAAKNISLFHRAQRERDMWSIEVREGVIAGRISRPMDCVGCYIPGGRAIYPSTILMTVIPAREAGVKEIVATTPAGRDMTVNPSTLVAADIAGCDRIFKVGGPWGIAALAYGTETLPKVDKIVGPGNKYVTAAKMIVYGQVDIDSPAGPSEALILADASANPEFVALDFLSQVEHDPDSSAVLVTTSQEVADKVCGIIEREYPHLPRKEIFDLSLARHSWILIASDIDEAVDFTNDFAPEHLQIMTEEPFITLNRIKHAGSIFLGQYAPVPVGDYASGTNHVLPTGRCARMFSGLSIDDFIKRPTFQYLSKSGLSQLKNVVVTLAEAEGLPMHGRAVKARFS
jgi:histidinol dehydrogenase